MGSEHYCLRWNNHQSNLLGVFSQLLQDEFLVDVTLACDGHSVRAHKVVLSACSTYFQSLFTNHPDRHPIVILKDMKYCELKTLLEFMYKGEVNVEYSQLGTLLKTAESLQVKGLAEMTGEDQHPVSTETTTCSTIPLQNQPPATPNTHSVVTPNPNVTATTAVTNNSSLDMTSRLEKREDTSHDHSPPQTKRLRLKGRDSGESSEEDDEDSSAVEDVGSLRSEATTVPSPQLNEPVPGPSGVGTQIQQAPLSLKKENDWNRPVDERSTGESSSDFRELPDQDTELLSARTYPCMYCGASFPSQSKLTRHILSHSLETLKYREHHHLAPPLPIPLTTTPVKLEALNLDMHHHHYTSSHHREREETTFSSDKIHPVEVDFSTSGEGQASIVLCKFCGKSFPDVSSLIQHLPVHTGDRPFKCEFCGKAFKLRHHMKDHARVHTGERPFKCSLCGKTFSRSTILKAHEKTHYPKYVKKFLPPPPIGAIIEAHSPNSQQ